MESYWVAWSLPPQGACKGCTEESGEIYVQDFQTKLLIYGERGTPYIYNTWEELLKEIPGNIDSIEKGD